MLTLWIREIVGQYDSDRERARPPRHHRKIQRGRFKLTLLRPLPRQAGISRTSLLADEVLLRGLRERLPATTVSGCAAENIRDRWLSPVMEGGELNARFTERKGFLRQHREKTVRLFLQICRFLP